jgi:hypothetical protein
MKKTFWVLLVLVIVLGCGYCWIRFYNTGHYQIAFGNVEKTLYYAPTSPGGVSKWGKHETVVAPMCLKIDTVTGKVWVYNYSCLTDVNGVPHPHEVFEPLKGTR